MPYRVSCHFTAVRSSSLMASESKAKHLNDRPSSGNGSHSDDEIAAISAQFPDQPASPRHKSHPTIPTGDHEKNQQHLPYGLSELEEGILKRQVEIAPLKVTYQDLYRYATKIDWFVIAGSSICAIASGAALPLMIVIFGSLAGIFQAFSQGTTASPHFSDQVSYLARCLVYLGIGQTVLTYIHTVGFIYVGEHVSIDRSLQKYRCICQHENLR